MLSPHQARDGRSSPTSTLSRTVRSRTSRTSFYADSEFADSKTVHSKRSSFISVLSGTSSAASRFRIPTFSSQNWTCKSHNRKSIHDFALCYRAADSRLASAFHAKLELSARYQWPQSPPIVFFDRNCLGLIPSPNPPKGINLSKIVLYLITDTSMQKMSANLQKENKQDRFLADIEEGLALSDQKGGPILIPIVVVENPGTIPKPLPAFEPLKKTSTPNMKKKISMNFKAIGAVFRGSKSKSSKSSKSIENVDKRKSISTFDPFTDSNDSTVVEGNRRHTNHAETWDSLFSFQSVYLDPNHMDTAVKQILNIYEKEVAPRVPKQLVKSLNNREVLGKSHTPKTLIENLILKTDALNELFPPDPSPFFAHRDMELLAINNGMRSNHIVVLSGDAGIGKTSIASQFAQQNQSQYPLIFWISCESRNSAYSALQTMCTAAGRTVISQKMGQPPARKQIRKIGVEILSTRTDYLLILDQADDVGVVKEVFSGISNFGGSVIITTQNEEVAEFVSRQLNVGSEKLQYKVKMIRIRRWTIQQTTSFLYSRVPFLRSTDENMMRRLLSVVDGWPMAAEFLAGHIISRRLGPRGIGELFANEISKPFFAILKPLETVFRMSVAAFFDIDRNDSIQVSGVPYTPGAVARAAIMILGVSSCMASSTIPKEIFEAAVEQRYSDAYRMLVNMSLISGTPNFVNVHPAVQILSFNILGKHNLIDTPDSDVQIMWMMRTVRAMLISFPTVIIPENSEFAATLRIHAFHIIGNTNSEMSDEYIIEVIELSDRLLLWLHYWKDLERAKDLLQHQLYLTASLYADEESHPDIATALHNLGQVCLELGDLSEAKTYFDEAVVNATIVNGTRDCADVAASLNGLGQIASDQGNATLARTYFDEALKILKEVQKEETVDRDIEMEMEISRDIAVTLNNVGLCASSSGDYDTAWKSYNEALTIFIEVHGNKQNKDVAQTYTNLANVAHARGEYAEAIHMHTESLEIMKELYGFKTFKEEDKESKNKKRTSFIDRMSVRSSRKERESNVETVIRMDQPEIANHLSLLGTVSSDAGNYSDAEWYFKQALDTYTAAYGTENHPDCGLMLNNLGIAAYDKRDFDAAKKYYEMALSVYVSVHGTKNHIDCAMAINNLGLVASDRGDKELAEGYFKEALETKVNVYGTTKHKDCASTLNNLGLVASDRKDFKSAEKYYEEAIEILTVVHGTRFQEQIGMTLNNLANIKLDANELDAAGNLYNDALEIFLRVFGSEDHPFVTTTKGNIQIIEERKLELVELNDHPSEQLA
ncbi:hypothetical protein HK098_005216 [Nowakowskiella sp. JEL0407]|nr:hypothetical protein HK098_005216 [Nowakowskiella sp. JEL0407]